MFELPGLNGSGDPKKDLEQVRRWLARFVPELEQQLSNLGTDNFTSAYNERVEGLATLTGAAKSKTTAEAVAEHLLDKNNPHGVTLNQLGHKDPSISMEATDHGWVIKLCGLMIQAKYVQASLAPTQTSVSGIYEAAADMGDWDVPFGTLSACWARVTYRHAWVGCVREADEQSAGYVYVYRTNSSIDPDIVIFGIGGVSDGGEAKESDYVR